MAAKILVVDDEVDLQELVKRKFRREIRHGEFEFEYLYVDTSNEIERTLRKGAGWARTHDNDSVRVDVDLRLASTEELLEVSIDNGSIECTCHSQADETVFHPCEFHHFCRAFFPCCFSHFHRIFTLLISKSNVCSRSK